MKLWDAFKIANETGQRIRPVKQEGMIDRLLNGEYPYSEPVNWIKNLNPQDAELTMAFDWELEPLENQHQQPQAPEEPRNE